jgi:hypothetical protein
VAERVCGQERLKDRKENKGGKDREADLEIERASEE